MTDAPETITKIHWRYHPEDMDCIGDAMENVQYTRTDHSQALIAAAYEAAVSAAYTGDDWPDRDIEPSIRELTPADAQAALDTLIADAERRGMERAAVIVEPNNPRNDRTERAHLMAAMARLIRAEMEPKT
jgi:hypothetical protein